MVLDPWDVLGGTEMTEYWRSVVPALSADPADDQTDVENDRQRVASVRQRNVLELKHLTRSERSRGFVTTRLTRISDWSPLTDEERHGNAPTLRLRCVDESRQELVSTRIVVERRS